MTSSLSVRKHGGRDPLRHLPEKVVQSFNRLPESGKAEALETIEAESKKSSGKISKDAKTQIIRSVCQKYSVKSRAPTKKVADNKPRKNQLERSTRVLTAGRFSRFGQFAETARREHEALQRVGEFELNPDEQRFPDERKDEIQHKRFLGEQRARIRARQRHKKESLAKHYADQRVRDQARRERRSFEPVSMQHLEWKASLKREPKTTRHRNAVAKEKARARKKEVAANVASSSRRREAKKERKNRNRAKRANDEAVVAVVSSLTGDDNSTISSLVRTESGFTRWNVGLTCGLDPFWLINTATEIKLLVHRWDKSRIDDTTFLHELLQLSDVVNSYDGSVHLDYSVEEEPHRLMIESGFLSDSEDSGPKEPFNPVILGGILHSLSQSKIEYADARTRWKTWQGSNEGMILCFHEVPLERYVGVKVADMFDRLTGDVWDPVGDGEVIAIGLIMVYLDVVSKPVFFEIFNQFSTKYAEVMKLNCFKEPRTEGGYDSDFSDFEGFFPESDIDDLNAARLAALDWPKAPKFTPLPDYSFRTFHSLRRQVYEVFQDNQAAFDFGLSYFSGVCFAYQIKRAKKPMDYHAAVFQFLRANWKLPWYRLFRLAKEFAKNTWLFMRKCVRYLRTESFFDDLSDGLHLEFLSCVMDTAIFKAFRKLIVSLVSFNFFSVDFSLRLESLFGAARKITVLDFCKHVLTFVQNVIKLASDVYSGVPLTEALLSTDPVYEVTRNIENLLVYQNSLYTGLPVTGQMCIKQYVSEMTDHTTLAEALLKRASPFKESATRLRVVNLRALNSIQLARGRMTARQRMTPVAVVLHGDPQVGKSQVLPLFAEWFANVKGRPFSDSHIYNRVPSSDYWEGMSESQPYIHYSELGNASRDVIAREGDKSIDELNRLVDSLPFNCDMAAAELKGNVFARPDVVLIDTNNPGLHIDALVCNPAALKRRFIYVEQIVKPEFRKDNGRCGIDPVKAFQYEGPYLDKWFFNVYEYDPQDVKKSQKVVHLHNVTIFELETWYKERVRDHITHYERTAAGRAGRGVPTESGWFDSEPILGGRTSLWKDVRVKASQFAFNCSLFARQFANSGASASSSALRWLTLTFMLWGYTNDADSVFAVSWTRGLIALFLSAYGWYHAVLPLCLVLAALLFVDTSFFVGLVARKRLSESRDSSWTRLRNELHYLGYLCSNSNQLFAPYVSSRISAIQKMVGMALIFISLKFTYDILFKKDEEEKSCNQEAAVHDGLVELQDSFHCGDSWKRIPNRLNHQIWNMQQLHSLPVYTGTGEGLMKCLGTNIRLASVHRTGVKKGEKTHILGLCGDVALVNRHVVEDLPCTLSVPNRGVAGAGEVVHATALSDENVLLMDNDLALVRLTGVRFKSQLKHISDHRYVSGSRAGRIGRTNVRVHFSDRTLKLNAPPESRSVDQRVSGYAHYEWPAHKPGLCGIPLLCQVGNGWQVVGIHCAGYEGVPDGYSTVFSRIQLEDGIKRLLEKSPFMEVASESAVYAPFATDSPCFKSPVRFLPMGGVNYLGKIPGPVMINARSRLQRTVLGKEVAPLFDRYRMLKSVEYRPPVMKPFTRRNGEYVSPYNLAFEKLSAQKGVLNLTVLSRIVKEMTDRFVSGLRDRGVPQLSPLSVETAVNGAVQDAFLRRINASTSSGFGLAGKKSKHIPLEDEYLRMPTEELNEKLYALLCAYKEREAPGMVYCAKLKDEPRDIAKVRAGKTRVFYAQSLDGLIVQRMFLSPFYTLMVQFNDLFCTSVGINMHSGVHQIADPFLAFTSTFLEGDYSAYDQTMPTEVGWAVSTVIENVLKEMGYNDESLILVRGILSDCMFPLVEMNLDVFEVPGLQPSGKYATAEDNSLRSLVMLMYAWYVHPDLKDMPFFGSVLPVTYGDDMIVAVKEEVVDRYNCIYYAQICEKLFRMKFTPANKGDELVPYKTFTDLSFLKRTFVYDHTWNKWKAPLAVDSIIKSLEWTIPSKVITQEEQLISTCASALWELFFHLDKSQWIEFRSDLLSLMHIRTDVPSPELNDALPLWNDVVTALGWE